jgi:hypothetical protein
LELARAIALPLVELGEKRLAVVPTDHFHDTLASLLGFDGDTAAEFG